MCFFLISSTKPKKEWRSPINCYLINICLNSVRFKVAVFSVFMQFLSRFEITSLSITPNLLKCCYFSTRFSFAVDLQQFFSLILFTFFNLYKIMIKISIMAPWMEQNQAKITALGRTGSNWVGMLRMFWEVVCTFFLKMWKFWARIDAILWL